MKRKAKILAWPFFIADIGPGPTVLLIKALIRWQMGMIKRHLLHQVAPESTKNLNAYTLSISSVYNISYKIFCICNK